MQCVILVGGLGTRLGSLTRDCPKPMLPVGGRPFLERLIENAARFGADEFLLLAGYRAEVVAEHFPHGVFRAHGRTVKVDVVAEPEPLGTGGALAFAADRLAPEFFMMNGDSLFSFNWLDLTTGLADGAVGRIGLRSMDDVGRYGVVETADDGRVLRFLESAERSGPGSINGGVYWLRREILDFVPRGRAVSLEREVFPVLAAAGRLEARAHDGSFIDIGIPSDFEAAQTMASGRRGAIFFDRDGVLNEDFGYVHRKSDFVWRKGAREAVRLANDLDLYVFVVTNQAGVAHGYYSEADIRRLHRDVQADLAEIGAHIDAFRYCPHHPEGRVDAYRAACSWRKPRPGMLLDLLAEWDVDTSRSLLIGDKDGDIDAAAAVGLRGVKVEATDPTVDIAGVLRDALAS